MRVLVCLCFGGCMMGIFGCCCVIVVLDDDDDDDDDHSTAGYLEFSTNILHYHV